MRIGFAACAVLFALVGSAALAQEEKPKPAPAKTLEELDARLAATFKETGIPGASVAIIEKDQIVFAKGYGVSDVAKGTPVTPETVFRAGSISKNFVGVAVMMLVEEGKLDLEAKLADLAPEIPFTNKWEASDPVRLVHLMEHTTGFDDLTFRQYLFDGKDMPLKQAIGLYGPYASRWRPGTYVAYANAPPVIAGYIVEKASGESWADFTRTRIFEPLGMTSAHWDKAPEIVDRLSKSYAGDGKTEQPYVDIPGKPAGSLNVTPTDLAKFAIMMADRGTANGHTLLKPESVLRIETPHSTLASRLGLADGYGFGNVSIAREKAVFHGHDGGIDGFLSAYGYDPEHKSGFVIMVNAAKEDALRALDLVADYLCRDLIKPDITEVKPAPGQLDKISGVYQSVSPRIQMLEPLELMLEWVPVTVKGDRLNFGGAQRIHLGNNVFQRIDRAAPSVVFATDAEQTLMLTATGAKRKVPERELYAKAAYGGLYGLALLVSAVYLLVWLVSLFLGRLGERGGVLVRLIPTLAIAAVPAFLVLLLMTLSDPSFEAITTLGTRSPVALTLYGVSYAAPVFGLLSVILALITGNASPFARGLAFVNGGLALSLAAWLYQYGWVGFQSWQ